MDGAGQKTRTGGECLVRCLEAQGVEIAFGVPGESYLAVLDALHDASIRFVLCRQEGGAAFMAEGYAKLTGRVGVCFVTRGPGATNASIGIHAAMQASSPLVVFVGQIDRSMTGREAFQELDYPAVFGTMAKWAVEVRDAERLPEIVGRAFATALGGRPGPVVVSLPEDMLRGPARAAPLSRAVAAVRPRAGPEDVWAVGERLAEARRPLVLLGGGGWEGPGGRAALAAFTARAEEAALPVAVTFRCQDLIDNASPAYAGDAGVGMLPYMQRLIAEADVILAVNIRFGENTTGGYTLLGVPEATPAILHVHPAPGELNRIYQAERAICADPVEFLARLAETPVEGAEGRAAHMAEARRGYEAVFEAGPQPGGVDMVRVMAHLREALPDDAIVTCGAGNFAIWPGRLFRYGTRHRFMGPQAGAMGAGIPYAVAAMLAEPARRVVCFAGDGDFQMTMQELGTAMQHDARPVVIVLNNGTYGTIRMHQERDYPGRVSGTELQNPDFCAIARAYGMAAARVESTDAFPDALADAMASPTGGLIEILWDKEGITPGRTLTDFREGR